MQPQAPYLWIDGQLVPWEQATFHAATLGWSTVAGVFEGIQAYWNDQEQELYVFQLPAHMERLASSMRLMRMKQSFTAEQLVQGTVDLMRACEFRSDAYVFPLAFHAGVTRFGTLLNDPVSICIRAYASPSNLGSGRAQKACVASWTRISDNVLSPRIKCISNYQNSRMALMEAVDRGCEQPILLNERGKVAEGANACVFMVRDGTLVTPPVTAGLLESITRSTVLKLGREVLGLQTAEREIDRTELYVAEEVFLCGTRAEITPLGWVDAYQLGDGGPGPVTRRLEQLYHDVVRGRDARHPEWRTPVYAKVAVEA
jgi:branched-chain amino acid aminotransferase